MPDHMTACLAADEANVRAILTAAPFNHTYIETFGPFTNGDLFLNTFASGGAPSTVGGIKANGGNTVVVHTKA